jgi:hypothetical protein
MSSAERRTPTFGPLKLTIGDQVILLDNAADGETHPCTGGGMGRYVRWATERTNRAFVEKSGKWTAFGVSAVGASATFIGDVLRSVEPVAARSGKVTGTILRLVAAASFGWTSKLASCSSMS